VSLEQRQERRFQQEKKKHKESVTKEVEDYLTLLHSFMETTGVDEDTGEGILCFDKWTNLLADFPSALAQDDIRAKGKEVADYWVDNLVPLDPVYSTKRFDIVTWWSSVEKAKNGGGQFATLALLATVHLSQPYTNAFLERVFSRGTWIDGARSQRILDRNFEMRVLDGSNRAFVELAKPALDLKDKVEKVDTKATTSAIQEAVARFAKPLVVPRDPMEESVVEVYEGDDDETESVVGLTDAEVAANKRREEVAIAKKEAKEKLRKEAKDAGLEVDTTSDDETSLSGESIPRAGDEDDSGESKEDASLFRALDSFEDFDKGIADVVRYMESNKTPAPGSATKKSSTKSTEKTTKKTK
jgi:hypothetical protein